MEENQELEKKAIEDLPKEAKHGKIRAETMGTVGCMKCLLDGTNKRFIINTILSMLSSHKEQDYERKGGNKRLVKSQDHKEMPRSTETTPILTACSIPEAQ